MRQQEANQFDKGMNLDTNPIAMDNHTLTSALNATMITMNGNELVLLNDMGNAAVDQAQLPEGYVPVGMKEYGGIVYVASHNPIEGKSLIGCFPSPQRNLSSEETGLGINLGLLTSFVNTTNSVYRDNKGNYYANSGANLTPVGQITETQKRILLIGDEDDPTNILRTGDKFVIYTNSETDFDDSSSNINNNYEYISLKAVVVDNDNTGIDISDTLISPSGCFPHCPFLKKYEAAPGVTIPETDFSIYKNKIAGKLYLKQELIIPSYINVSLSAQIVNPTTVQLKITPKAYDLANNGFEVLWSRNQLASIPYMIKIEKTVSGISLSVLARWDSVDGCFVCDVDNNARVKYTIWPLYEYREYVWSGSTFSVLNNSERLGRVMSLERSDTIDVASIGSGRVDFLNSTFRYFNDMATNQFVLEYSLKAYIENSSHVLNRVFLELLEVLDVLASLALYSDAYNWDLCRSDIVNPSLNPPKQILVDLGTLNYFGTYTKYIPYNSNNSTNRSSIDYGKFYIGRIVAYVDLLPTVIPLGTFSGRAYHEENLNLNHIYQVIPSTYPTNSDPNNPGYNLPYDTTQSPYNTLIKYYTGNRTVSSWYAVITSTITNPMYLEDSENMVKIGVNDALKEFVLPWTSKIERLDIGGHSSDSVQDGSSLQALLLELPSSVSDLILYTTIKEGTETYEHTITNTIPSSRDINDAAGGSIRLPFNLEFNPNGNYIKYPTITSTPNDLANTNPVKFSTDVTIEKETPSGQSDTSLGNISPIQDNIVTTSFSASDNSDVSGSVNGNSLTINYKLLSRVAMNLLKNPDASGNTINDYKFNLQTQMSAFVPYLPLYYTEQNKYRLENMLGPVTINGGGVIAENTLISSIFPSYWFTYCLNARPQQDSDFIQRVGLMNGEVKIYIIEYGNRVNDITAREVWTTIENCPVWNSIWSWENIVEKTRNVLRLKNLTPTILMWYSCSRDEGNILKAADEDARKSQAVGNGLNSIVIMFDRDGGMYLLNLFYSADLGNYPNILDAVLKNFGHIYICQPDLTVTCDYWRGDPNHYAYTNNYKLTTSYDIYVAVPSNSTPNITEVNGSNDINDITNINNYNNGQFVPSGETNGTYVIKLENVGYKLPRFLLDVGTKTLSYTDTFDCADQSVFNIQFLDPATPTLNTCAIVNDSNGQHIVNKAQRPTIVSNFGIRSINYESIPFRADHVYWHTEGDGLNAKLIDCNEVGEGTLGQIRDILESPRPASGGDNNSYNLVIIPAYGYKASLAIKQNKLQVISSDEHNGKILVVNRDRTSVPRVTSSKYCLGNTFYGDRHGRRVLVRDGRLWMTEVCASHILNLDLFDGVSLTYGKKFNT